MNFNFLYLKNLKYNEKFNTYKLGKFFNCTMDSGMDPLNLLTINALLFILLNKKFLVWIKLIIINKIF